MSRTVRNNRRGFTLVEILIVVIILGILAAIVIPQFSNASQDARKSSLTSQLQTLRSQINLYALQHRDQFPPGLTTAGTIAGATAWAEMTVRTNADHTTTGTPQFGPYLQAAPSNNLNGLPAVFVQTSTDHGTGAGNPAAGSSTAGWVFNSSTGKLWATAVFPGVIYDESNPAARGNTSSDGSN